MKTYEKISFLFTGTAYIAAGILILMYPRFFYLWIAAIFFIQGILSFIRAAKKTSKKTKNG